MNQQIVKFLIEAQDKASAIIKQVGDNVNTMTEKTKSVSERLSTFAKDNEKTFRSMSLYGTAAFAAIAYGAKNMIDAFSGAEAEMAKVDAVLKTLSDSTLKKAKMNMDELKDSINKVSQANIRLGFDDEATATSLAKLTAATGDYTKAQELNTLAMDLARYKSIDLGTASDVLIKVQAGQTRVLKELGIEVKEGTTAQEAYAIVMQKVAGQSEAYAKTVRGQQEAMKVAFDNLKETIGGALAPAFVRLTQALQPIIDKFTQWAEKNPELLSKIILIAGAIAGLVAVVGALGLALPGIIAGFTLLLGPVGLVITALGAVAAAVIRLRTVVGGYKEQHDQLIAQMDELDQKLKNGEISQLQYATSMQILGGEMEALKGKTSEFVQGWVATEDAINAWDARVTESVKNFAVGIRTSLQTAWTTIVADVQIFLSNFQLYRDTFRSALALSIFNMREGIKATFNNAWTAIYTTCTIMFGKIREFIVTSVTAIANFFKSAVTMINDGFSSMFSGIAGIAKNIFNGVIGIIESFVNFAIRLLNKLISAANMIPGVKIPVIAEISIQRLAHGGIVKGLGLDKQMKKFAIGGVVTGPGGIDNVPAMLTAGEMVLNAAQQRNLAGNLSNGQQGQIIQITITGNEFNGSGEDFAEKIGDFIMERFKKHAQFQSF